LEGAKVNECYLGILPAYVGIWLSRYPCFEKHKPHLELRSIAEADLTHGYSHPVAIEARLLSPQFFAHLKPGQCL